MAQLENLTRNLYHYKPSVGGNVAFIFVFLALTATHAYCAWRFRYKPFIPVLIGCLFEFLAYCIRAGARNYLCQVGAYAIQNLFVLLAPVLFAATIYMLLSRVVRVTNAAHHSPLRPSRLTRTFVTMDIICLLLQGNGGSLQAIDSSDMSVDLPTIGKWVTIAGLVLQMFVFAGFLYCAVTFQRGLNRLPTIESTDPLLRWQQHMRVLYVASGLVVLRNLVRVIEYCQGYDGWIIRHEVMLFVFDASLMAMMLIALAAYHPARLLGGPEGVGKRLGRMGFESLTPLRDVVQK